LSLGINPGLQLNQVHARSCRFHDDWAAFNSIEEEGGLFFLQ